MIAEIEAIPAPAPKTCCGESAKTKPLAWPPERGYLINLARRADRLTAFRERQESHGWQLPQPEIFQAIDGRKTGHPPGYKAGGGAWGCLRSHTAILERCLTDGVQSVLVLEDDVTWLPEAWDRLAKFVAALPNDWEGVFPGGQIKGRFTHAGPGVLRVHNCHRTHAYALRGRGIRDVLKLWRECPTHIDHWLPKWQETAKVYAPTPFIFGQAEGVSDILSNEQNEQPARFWSSQVADVGVLWIDPTTTRERIEQLRRDGVHTGNWRDENGHDRGLVDASGSGAKVRAVVDLLLREAPKQAARFVGVWHPSVSFADFKVLFPRAIQLNVGDDLPGAA